MNIFQLMRSYERGSPLDEYEYGDYEEGDEIGDEVGGPYFDGEEGGPEELGDYDESGAPRRRRKKKGVLGRFLKRGRKKRKSRGQVPSHSSGGMLEFQRPASPRAVGGSDGASTIVARDAPASAGVRFFREAGCSLTSTPIPLEARCNPMIGSTLLNMSAGSLPSQPIIATGTVAALPLLVATTAPLPMTIPAQYDYARQIQFFALRVDFGLPGLSASAAVPITFEVFTQVGGAGVAEDLSAGGPVQGSFSSGQCIVTPYTNVEISSVVILTYQVVAALPLPKLARIQSVASQVGSVPFELLLRVITAPVNTTATISILTPTHPSWQIISAELKQGGCC